MVSKQVFTQFFYVVHLKIHYIYTSNSTNQWFNTVIVVFEIKHMHMDRKQMQRISSSSSSITYLEFFFHFRNALSKIIKWLKFGFRHAWKIKY